MHKPIFPMFAVVMILAGCHPRPATMPTGAPMPPPQGAVDYCDRHPEVEVCK